MFREQSSAWTLVSSSSRSVATNRWTGPGAGKEISVQEAWELLEQSGGTLHFDKVSFNPTFTYIDDVEREQH